MEIALPGSLPNAYGDGGMIIIKLRIRHGQERKTSERDAA